MFSLSFYLFLTTIFIRNETLQGGSSEKSTRSAGKEWDCIMPLRVHGSWPNRTSFIRTDSSDFHPCAHLSAAGKWKKKSKVKLESRVYKAICNAFLPILSQPLDAKKVISKMFSFFGPFYQNQKKVQKGKKAAAHNTKGWKKIRNSREKINK